MNRRVHGVRDGSSGRAPHRARLVGRPMSRRPGSAPVRLDFAGGWTDVPPFSSREGGVVVVRRDRAARACRSAARRDRTSAGRRGPRCDARPPDESALGRVGAPGAAAGRASPSAGRPLRPAPPGPMRRRARGSAARARSTSRSWRAAGGARRGLDAREIARLACRLEGVEAGIPGGRQDQFTRRVRRLPAARLPRSRRDASSRSRSIPACSPSSSAACCSSTPAPRASRAPPSGA